MPKRKRKKERENEVKWLPESVETIIASVDLNWDSPSIRLGHAAIAFHDDELGPDLVVDLMPFVQNFLDVVLIQSKTKINRNVNKEFWHKQNKNIHFQDNSISTSHEFTKNADALNRIKSRSSQLESLEKEF